MNCPRLFLLVLVVTISAIAVSVRSLDKYNYPKYTWEEFTFFEGNFSGDKLADRYTQHPVYMTMTTIASRINEVYMTIEAMFATDMVPNRLYIFLSREKYLLDSGVSELPMSLVNTARKYPVSIVMTNNTGPHRKLLPLLMRKWNEDCAIVTVDDDIGGKRNLAILSQLVKYYVASQRESVVALRTRRIGVCLHSLRFLPYYKWHITLKYGAIEMLLLPTGTGGILYRPEFFHPVIFDPKLREITGFADDLMFRLGTLINRVAVTNGCRENTFANRTYTCSNTIRVFNSTFKNTVTYESQEKSSKRNRRKHRKNNENVTNVKLRRYLLSNELEPTRTSRQTTEAKSLFDINRRKNDQQWTKAISYLEKIGVINMKNLIADYIKTDRESICYRVSHNSSKHRVCSFGNC